MNLKETSTKLNKILREKTNYQTHPFFCVAYRDYFDYEIIVYFEPAIRQYIFDFFNISNINEDCNWEGYKIILKESEPPISI